MSILRRGAFVLALAPLALLTPALAADPVAERVEAFRAAQFVADGKALEALCAPELSYSHSDGRVEDRAAFIAGSTTGRSKYNKLEYREPKVTTVGDVSTVRFNWVGESAATSDGKISNTNLHVLMVWQKQGADWKLLARSATRL